MLFDSESLRQRLDLVGIRRTRESLNGDVEKQILRQAYETALNLGKSDKSKLPGDRVEIPQLTLRRRIPAHRQFELRTWDDCLHDIRRRAHVV